MAKRAASKSKPRSSTKKAPKNEEELDFLADDTSDDEFEDEDEDEDEEEDVPAALNGWGSHSEDDSPSDDAGWDIFTNFGAEKVKLGIPVYYIVYKDGHILGRKEHPYDLTALQRQHGGGTYRVICKNASTNQIMKSQTFALAGLPEEEKRAPTESGPAQPSMGEVLALMEKIRTDSKREADALQAKQGESQNTILGLLMQSMQTSNMQLLESIKQSNESNTRMIMAMMEQSNKMFQLQSQQTAQLLTAKKEKDFDPLTLVNLIQTAQDRGRKELLEIQNLMETKADDKAELLAKIEALEKGDKPSAVDKLIQSLAPVLAAAAAQQTQLSQSGQNSLPAPQHQTVREASTGAVVPIRPVASAPPTPARNPSPAKAGPRKVDPMNAKVIHPSNRAPNIREQAESLLVPFVGEALKNRIPPAQAQGPILAELKARLNLSPSDVKKAFTPSELEALPAKHGVPAFFHGAVIDWLKEFYALLPETESAPIAPTARTNEVHGPGSEAHSDGARGSVSKTPIDGARRTASETPIDGTRRTASETAPS